MRVAGVHIVCVHRTHHKPVCGGKADIDVIIASAAANRQRNAVIVVEPILNHWIIGSIARDMDARRRQCPFHCNLLRSSHRRGYG
jgi:hypothetical protein